MNIILFCRILSVDFSDILRGGSKSSEHRKEKEFSSQKLTGSTNWSHSGMNSYVKSMFEEEPTAGKERKDWVPGNGPAVAFYKVIYIATTRPWDISTRNEHIAGLTWWTRYIFITSSWDKPKKHTTAALSFAQKMSILIISWHLDVLPKFLMRWSLGEFYLDLVRW